MGIMKVGEYTFDSNRACWVVRLEDTPVGETYMDCETQIEAEILARLVRLDMALVSRVKIQ